jgi:hypothetical protein
MSVDEYVYEDGHQGSVALEDLGPRLTSFELSEPCDQLQAALVEAGKTLRNPAPNKTANITTRAGGAYSFNYSDLSSVFDCIREPLANAGLAIVQIPSVRPGIEEGVVAITTLLMHSSGQRLRMCLELPCSLAGEPRELFQRVGGFITWLRRVSAGSLFPIAAETETDTGRTDPPPAAGPRASAQDRKQAQPARRPLPGQPPAQNGKAAAVHSGAPVDARIPPRASDAPGTAAAAPSGKPPSAPAPVSRPADWRPGFDAKCDKARAILPEAEFTRILGNNGYTNQRELNNREHAQTIVNELREAALAIRRQNASQAGAAAPGGKFVNGHGVEVDDGDVPFGTGADS